MKFLLLLFLCTSVLADNNTVARVIMAETGSQCSSYERLLVAAVIQNRIGHKGFANGTLKTRLDVVNQKNAFSAIGNENWKLSANPDAVKSKAWQEAWQQCKDIANAKIQTDTFPDIVFFTTKGFKLPPNFYDFHIWKLTITKETKHFTFYNIKEIK